MPNQASLRISYELIFILLLALAVSGFVGSGACFAVFDIAVAFLHSRMDEDVFVHPPRADGLCKPGFCWKLRRAMNGTRRASRLWADRVRHVLEETGFTTLRVMSLVFWHTVLRVLLAVWGDDFGAFGSTNPLEILGIILAESFESKEM